MNKLLVLMMMCCFSFGAVAKDLESSSTGTVIPEKNKGGYFGTTVLPDTEGDFSAIAKDAMVAVPVFKVTFGKRFDASSRQESGNFRSSASAKINVAVEVKGFHEEVLQTITDLAYEDLIQRLQKKKLKVMSREEMLEKSPALKKTAASKKFPDIGDDESAYLAAGTMFPSGFLNVNEGRLTKAPSDIFTELKSGLITANYFLDYVAAGKSGSNGSRSGKISASIELGQVANVSGFIQSFGFKDGACTPFGSCSGPQSIVQLQQVAYSTIPFGTLKEASTTGDTAVNVVSGVLGFLGGKSSVSSSTYELTVEETEFVKASVDALKEANKKLVEKL